MRTNPPDLEPCPGCERPYPRSGGDTHLYIGASAGCWSSYGELLALEYGGPRLMRWHRLTVDAYAAQHPGLAGFGSPGLPTIRSSGRRLSSRSLHIEDGGPI